MNVIKSIVLKFILLAVLMVGFNFVYKFTLFEKDLQTYSPIINSIREVVDDKCEVVYVGESSNFTARADDKDKRAISDFIADYFPSKKFGTISKGACHAGMYYEWLRNIPEKSSVKTIIVTLNLRSFDANWIYSSLETPLQKEIVLLKDYPPLYNRFLLSFRGYDIKTDAEREKQYLDDWTVTKLNFSFPHKYKTVREWDRAIDIRGVKNTDSTRNQPLTELTCHYVKTYAFQIDTSKNPRIKDFDRIVTLAKERQWNLVFNLMAENTKLADSLVGKPLIYLIKQNRDLLVARYSRMKVCVVDNLESVPDEEFIDRTWTTEHYAERGRRIIAKNVADSLKKYFN